MNDIANKNDIVFFVKEFYKKVKNDEILGPIFEKKIKPNQWTTHLDRMNSFWNTVLFGERDYQGNPFSHHISLGIETKHFDRWINLFEQTIQSNYAGVKAEEAIYRANKMRQLFENKLARMRLNPNSYPII